MKLTAEEKAFLLDVARRAVAAAVKGQEPPAVEELAAEAGIDLEPRLVQKRGAFVTLHLGESLRGCIGYIEGHKPLAEAVAANGRSSAVGDPRFVPVSERELPHLSIEVSALTPLVPVAGPEEIVIGRHGIVLEAGGRSSVFLPQVATEQGWDLETTLGHLALKAGLGPQGWQEGARYKVFEAEVF
jgi:AmmeMemoRadiSam system protein A